MLIQCPNCAGEISVSDDETPHPLLCPACCAEVVPAGETVTNTRDGGDETATFVPPDPAAGGPAGAIASRRFGHYELLDEIARGGMGVVFKARQISLNRLVALKMIKAGELAREEDVKRFRAEAEAAANLDHPNIVPIYEVGEQNGRNFFSMGYVEGESLQEKLAGGPLPPKEAAELMQTVAAAVQFAHDRGIVHRDLKPANVLIDAAGRPKVTDFGLAKNIRADTGMTATGQVLGTPGYMPPEQAAGKIDDIGPLSDVYSMGAMLYCLLTGRPPFQAATIVETVQQVLGNNPVSPRVLNPAVPRDLETICLRCLAKDPAERFFKSAAELADDLRRFLNDEPVRVRRIGPAARFGRWCRKTWNERRRWVLATASVAVLAAVAVVVSLFVFERGRRDSELADLKGRFEAGLKERDWSPAHLEAMDRLVNSLETLEADEAEAARTRLDERFAEVIRSAIRRPKIDGAAAAAIERSLKLLESRDQDVALQLRREFEARMPRREFVVQLEPPFQSVGDVFDPSRASIAGASLRRANARSRSDLAVLTRVADGDYVSLEAVFGPQWEGANLVGLVLNGSAGKGYRFELRTVADGASQSPQPFENVRKSRGAFALRIVRDGQVLRSIQFPAPKVPAGKLQMSAARDGQWLTVTVNNQPPLRFFEVFPAASAGAGRFGILWPPNVPLQRLYASRRVLPPSPSALETGDRLYLTGDYSAARAFYQKQAVQSAGSVDALESRVKEALCLIAGGDLNEAARILETVWVHRLATTSAGRRWRNVAGAQLLLVRIRQKNAAAAETLIEQMAITHAAERRDDSTLATVASQTLQTEILEHFKSSAGGMRLWRPDPGRIRKLELAIQVEKLLGLDKVYGMWTQLELVRAHRAAGNVAAAIKTAEGFLKTMPLEARGFNVLIVREHAWMARTADPPGPRRDKAIRSALVELDRRLFLDPSAKDPAKRFRPLLHELLVERARLHLALGDAKRAAADLEDFFRHAPRPQDAYRVYSDACLLRGFLYQDAGLQKQALDVWKKALYPGDLDVNSRNARFGGSIGVLNALIAAGLTRGMPEKDVERMFAGIMAVYYPESAVTGVMNLAKSSGVRPILLADMWRSPQGRVTARKIVLQSVPFREYMRLPAVLAAATVAYSTAFQGKPTEDQQRLIWDTFDEALEQTFSGKIKFGFVQMLPLGLVWKGTSSYWTFLKGKFPKPLRAKASYILGLRYRRKGWNTQADAFFREAIAGASGNELLIRLARAELNRPRTATP